MSYDDAEAEARRLNGCPRHARCPAEWATGCDALCRDARGADAHAGHGCAVCWLAHWQETGEALGEDVRPRFQRVVIRPLWQVAGEARREVER